MLLNRLLTRNLLNLNKRIQHAIVRHGSDSAAYDGDGKTTVRVLNDEEPHLNLVNTYSSGGFRLANNVFIYGSMLLFPTYVYSWNVSRGIDITPESLLLFDLIVPKTKIVIIGYGEKGEPYDAKIPLILKKKGISCEMLPTPSAVTTYNFLVHDSVHVAGAFVPVMAAVKETRKDAAPYERDVLLKETPFLEQYDPISHEQQYWKETIKKKIEYEKKHTDPDKKTFDN